MIIARYSVIIELTKERRKNMKGLTKQELDPTMEAENIFNQSATAFYNAVEMYVKTDTIALINLYIEKVGE